MIWEFLWSSPLVPPRSEMAWRVRPSITQRDIAAWWCSPVLKVASAIIFDLVYNNDWVIEIHCYNSLLFFWGFEAKRLAVICVTTLVVRLFWHYFFVSEKLAGAGKSCYPRCHSIQKPSSSWVVLWRESFYRCDEPTTVIICRGLSLSSKLTAEWSSIDLRLRLSTADSWLTHWREIQISCYYLFWRQNSKKFPSFNFKMTRFKSYFWREIQTFLKVKKVFQNHVQSVRKLVSDMNVQAFFQ